MDELKEMSSQEVFNIVYKHLLQQGRQSFDPTIALCAYRSKDGLSCAVGCLLTDEEYISKMEGKNISYLMNNNLFPGRLIPHIDLLSDLQEIHDHQDSDVWEDCLKQCAVEYSLTIPDEV